jgi:hypothetical protein
MPANLDNLPLDVLYNVSSSLDLDSFVSLRHVSRQLHSLSQEEHICRQCLIVSRSCPILRCQLTASLTYAKSTREAVLASRPAGQSLTYREALRRLSSIREAYKTANPFSCSVLAYGAAFLYKQGVLCYLEGSELRFLDLNEWSCEEQVIDIQALACDATGASSSFYKTPAKSTLLSYQDNILAFLFELDADAGGSWLIAIDRRIPEPNSPVIFVRPLETTSRLFVRQDASSLFYGTHTHTNNSHHHREWLIEGTNLKTSERYPPVQLDDFVGTDLGLTVCFEIYNGYFYALSNQTSFDLEEIDWTSYYHCIRFPVADPTAIQAAKRIWRRQHIEGPINDTWTNLSLHLDEETDRVVVVECRREWKGGGSDSMRTFYNEPLPFTGDNLEASYLEYLDSLPEVGNLPDDILTTQIDETNNPNYDPDRPRASLRFHPEYPPNNGETREFILARTKHRTYNLSCHSFLDLVNDPISYTSGDRLRLRIGHRKLCSPMTRTPAGTYTLREPEYDYQGKPVHGSEQEIQDRGIRMWPPDDAPPELLQILNPTRSIGQVDAASDERSVVYMTGPSYSQNRAVVIINFDPTARKLLNLQDSPLKRLYHRDRPFAPGLGNINTVAVDVERMKFGDRRGEQRRVTIDPALSTPAAPCFRTERARYLDIKKGFWLR